MSGEAPQQLYDEAALLNARIFHVGNDWNAVIAWADSWIERLDVFPDELVEISLGGSRKDSGARAALAQLALKGRLDVRVILRKALQELDAGANPFELLADLYPLIHGTFIAGGLKFVLDVSDPLVAALYRLDFITEEIDETGWNPIEGAEAQSYLREQMQIELAQVLAQIE
ncbi:hypothetical protein [Deinococcus sp. SL84]|uniref:hypothetical protein n=1 Tax=Deinococcus sp. SL84 TaxID=2994663 RepID=UPI00227448B0|nr:hypothetical protein [Deinococcus sp. SL84]MCY1703360.1 hypothetical protein [Deinococcus sp. SL84]